MRCDICGKNQKIAYNKKNIGAVCVVCADSEDISLLGM